MKLIRRYALLVVWVFLTLTVMCSMPVEAQTVRADRFTFNTGPCVLRSGSGDPNGSVVGNVCDTYWRTDTGTIYNKTSGTGTNTGWVTSGLTGSGTANTVTKWTGTTSLGNSTTTDDGTTLTFTSSGNAVFNNGGDIITNPTGNDILPTSNYDINIGSIPLKYLSLSVGELIAETLVAQDVMATIGGRILVAPTTVLTADLAAGTTTITVKHNNLANGDRVYMQSSPGGVPQVEFMAITSGAGGSAGAYTYTVTRNLDGTGANQWYAGDAVLNTGTTGDGFIDLYSTSGVKAGTEIGPTIVGNVRTSTTFNAWEPRWAIGNLNGLYGYSSDIYGAGFGSPAGSRVTIENTNGIRLFASPSATGARITLDNASGLVMYGGDNDAKVTIDTSGNATFDGKITIGTGRNILRNSECRVGTENWSTLVSGHSATITLGTSFSSSWRLNNEPSTCYINAASQSPVNGSITYALLSGQKFPATANVRYEASAYIGLHRSSAAVVYLDWYDSGGSLISTSATSNTCTTAAQGGTDLSGYCRAVVLATAPSGTLSAQFVLRTTHDGSNDPFTFWTRAYFGEASTVQEDATEWGPAGITEITGGLIKTDAIDARTIAADAITTSELAADSVTSAKIVAGTIVASDIATSTITADRLSVSTLSAIAANLGTITAGSITGVTATFGGSGGTVTLNSSGVTLTSGSDTEDRVKWDDGSNIRSASDAMTLQADSSVTILGPSFINLDTSGGTISLDATTVDVAGTISMPGYSTTTSAHYPLVLDGSTDIVAKSDGANQAACNAPFDVEYGIVVSCSAPPAPAPDLASLQQRVSDLEAQVAQLYTQLQALLHASERRQ